MVLNDTQTARPTARQARLLEALRDGIPLVERPYADISRRLGWGEAAVLEELRALNESGVFSRYGVVVRHHELGFTANAMVVWDVTDSDLERVAGALSGVECVTLCYQRPRRLPMWPFNLFTMIHGKSRASVLARLDDIVAELGLQSVARQVLFSKRRFKQRGAYYT